jgi:serine/threonine protein kinase/tetratricopeptide (TPR) repeat protein
MEGCTLEDRTMPADPKRVQDIFLAAVTQTDRAAVLDRECGADAELRHRVEALLRAHDDPGSLQVGLPVPTADEPPPEGPGGRVGLYKLLQKLGEGGMGTVYLAEQTEPVRRRVALKIIKPGLDSAHVLARFEQERQALAMMDHPNIAKVLDAGTTDSPLSPGGRGVGGEGGTPFFVMELVKGVPITKYCDQEHLTPRERLELFVPVCQAVQHAHQKGIIHRDLKPSNVLIALYDGKPVPKVIDFGVAKSTAQNLTERTVFTEVGQIVGTLEYMAPEQAELNNLDIDTRADIYSLGTLLYELLTGSTPFCRQQLRSAALSEMLRIIREVEPPRPSTKLSASAELPAIAAKRKSEPKRLTRLVHGDLDWIVMKCLEKERARRYETASGLALDLGRYLRSEPVSAGPPGAGYRLRKFVRRNKGPVLAAALVLLALVGGVIGTTWGLVEARQQRDVAEGQKQRAEDEAAISRAVSEFLQKDLLGQADIRNQPLPGGAAGRNRNITVGELLDRASKGIEGKFADQPLTEAAIRQTLGTTYRGLGRFAEAQPHLERSVQLRTAKLGLDHPDTLSSKQALADLFLFQDNRDQGESLLKEVIAARTAKLGADHLDTLYSKHVLAGLYHFKGELNRAEILYKEVIAARADKLGADHPDTLYSKQGLADVYLEQGKNDQAEPLLKEGVQRLTAKLGADHPDTLYAKLAVVWLYSNRGEYDRAEKLCKEVHDGLIAKLGADNLLYTGIARNYLAGIYRIQRKYNQAESLLEEMLAVAITQRGPAHDTTLRTKKDLAVVYRAQGKYDRAERLFKEVIDVALAKHPLITMSARRALAVLYRDQGKYDKAEPLFKQAIDARVAMLGAEHTVTLLCKNDLAILYRDQGKYDRAEPLHREAADGARKKLGLAHPHTQTYIRELSACYERMGQPARGEPLLRELVDLGKQKDADAPSIAATRAALGANLLAQQKATDAEPPLRQALATLDKHRPDEWATSHTRSLLGAALLGQKKYADAEPFLVQGYEGMKQREARIPTGDRFRLAEAVERLVQLYEATGQEEQAARWRKKREAKEAK